MSHLRLFLFRHGEVEDRYHHIFGGSRIDMELSPLGRRQADRLAEYLSKTQFDAIYCSPMKRARQTLVPLASIRPVTIEFLDALHEVDFGDWTGLSWKQVMEKYKISAFEWLDKLEQANIPGAESASEFRARVEPCLQHILGRHPTGNVGIVCHGGVVRMILSILLQVPITRMAGFDVEYASVTIVKYVPNRVEAQLINFTPWRDLP
jgi:broad specificity phosphatase PhoE